MKYIVGSLVLLSSFAQADTWLSSTNRMAKHDLQFLSSRSIITTPVTTFPIPWQTIMPQLKSATALTSAEQKAIDRLLHQYRLAQKIQIEARIGSDEYSLPTQANRQDGNTSLSASASYNGDVLKAKVSADLANGDFNGSYLALEQFGWLFSVGAQDQFWGPSNDTSLIYSDYSHALPALSAQRVSAAPSELPLFNLLGPWSFKAQLAQLEQNRAVPKARLWSARLNVKPTRYLELGFSHAAQWGGTGFGNGITDFFDVITGKEYCVDGEASCSSARMSKFGNQLAGIDFNLQLNMLDMNVNLYGQTIGEDAPTDNILPADKVTLFGVSSYKTLNSGLLKFYFETIDSNLSCGKNSAIKNCFYEHTQYQSGYRYRGLPIGSIYDNDSTSYVLGASFSNHQHFAEAKIKHLQLNQDSSDIATVSGNGGHYLVDKSTELILLEYSHQYQWSEHQTLAVELQSKLKGSLAKEDDHIVNLVYKHYF